MTPPTPLTPATPLDSFETDLLSRLRTEVTERPRPLAPSMGLAATGRPEGRRRRGSVVAAAGAVAVALAAAGTLWATPSSPAYAVDTDSNGDVTVSITRFDDAAGLQAALAAHGIRSQIDYLPSGQVCAPGQYREAEWNGTLSIGHGRGPDQQVSALFITVPKATWRPELTLVLGYSGDTERTYGSAGVADGPVAPCQPMDFPHRGGLTDVPNVQPGEPPVSRAEAS